MHNGSIACNGGGWRSLPTASTKLSNYNKLNMGVRHRNNHENGNDANRVLAAVTCLDIELAIMKEFNFRQNLIVPNITNMMCILPFETDMLVLTNSLYAYGFEIKVSKLDLKADFKKPQHCNFDQMLNGKTGFERYYGKFKYFYYAVPEQLKEYALEVIPDFCGLWVLAKYEYPGVRKFYQAKEPKKLFDRKWSENERYEIARLGTMRIYSLKQSLCYRS